MPAPEIHRLACLSTGHVAADVAAELDRLCDRPIAAFRTAPTWRTQLVVCPWQEFGWWVWVPSPGRDGMPPSLRACLDLAEAAGALWIQFDRDCAPLASLPFYDW